MADSEILSAPVLIFPELQTNVRGIVSNSDVRGEKARSEVIETGGISDVQVSLN